MTMTRGQSLKQDLRLLINNPKYSDIEMLFEDEKKLYGNRAILAARTEVFDALLYNGMKESYERQISFPGIHSSGMEIVLEYIYTGMIKEESLTKENIVEAYSAADYFQVLGLQDFIMKTVKSTLEKNHKDNYSPELLTKIVDTMALTEDNIFLNLLVETVTTIQLNTIEFGRLSIAALQYILTCTHEKEKPFATPEYEVFRYSAILAASQVSSDAYKTLLKRLPTIEEINDSKKRDHLKQINNGPITDHQKVTEELESLIEFIDFKRIKTQILTNVIKPLEIIPAEMIHRNKVLDLNEIREVPIYTFNDSDCVWDKSACGSNLIIKDDGKVIQALNSCETYQSVRTKVALESKGIFEWDIIIEKTCQLAWVGVCTDQFDHERFVVRFVLGSNGTYYQSNCLGDFVYYCPSFESDNSKVTVRLDMNQRTCAFTVNGIKYPVVSKWNDLPSKLYPVVSLRYPGQFRIQPH